MIEIEININWRNIFGFTVSALCLYIAFFKIPTIMEYKQNYYEDITSEINCSIISQDTSIIKVMSSLFYSCGSVQILCNITHVNTSSISDNEKYPSPTLHKFVDTTAEIFYYNGEYKKSLYIFGELTTKIINIIRITLSLSILCIIITLIVIFIKKVDLLNLLE